jgi:hypothetical protein
METTKTKTCGRCNGTGSYSYNPQYGTMCLGCGGTGIKGRKASKRSIPTPHGCYLSECILGWYVFIPRYPKSISGASVQYKTKEAALTDYPNAEMR